MVSENVDLVRSIYADWECGDFGSLEWADPENEYVIADGPAPGSWTGVAAMVKAWRDRMNAWEDLSFTADEYREVDDERVLVLANVSGRGKTSGLDMGSLSTQGASLCHISGGKVTRLVLYFDRDLAFADLGLSPETDSP
jgi:ketosteroid isomerase-like protein